MLFLHYMYKISKSFEKKCFIYSAVIGAIHISPHHMGIGTTSLPICARLPCV